MHDPFALAAERIVRMTGFPCVYTNARTGERVTTVAVLDRDVEMVDELGQIIEREDAISLLISVTGVPKSGDKVWFEALDATYKLGRTFKNDGYVAQLQALKQ